MYKNPSYALIEVDEETMLPLNYQMWALDIQKANAAENTTTSDKWELVLDYVKDYKLDGYVTPNEMHKLAVKVGESRSMASLFRWQMARNVGVPTDITIKETKQMSCMLQTSEVHEQDNCNGVPHGGNFG